MSSMSDVKDEAHFLIKRQFLVHDSHGFIRLYTSRCICPELGWFHSMAEKNALMYWKAGRLQPVIKRQLNAFYRSMLDRHILSRLKIKE